MNLLLSPALRLVLSSTNLRTLNITILNQRCPAYLHSLIESNLFILYEAGLPVILLTVLLLLGLIVCDVSSVAPLVIGVITLHNIVILSLLNHLNLVNTFLASSCYSSEANIWSFRSLTISTNWDFIERLTRRSIMVIMVVMMMII